MDATLKSVRKIGLVTAGMTLLVVGFIMLFLPGPGVLVMVAGLSLLAREFRWASIALTSLRSAVANVGGITRRAFARAFQHKVA